MRRAPIETSRLLAEYLVLGLSLALFLGVLPARPEMASAANLENIVLGMVLLGVLAMGETVVLITGGIDLALPAVMSLASVVGGSIMAAEGGSDATGRLVVALVAMLAVGLAVGAVQGAAIGFLRMPAFLVSLALLMFLGGLAVWYTQSERIAVPQAFTRLWYGRAAAIPLPVFYLVVWGAAAHVLLAHTKLGRHLYAVGHNPRTSLVSGVPVGRTIMSAYMVSGLSAATAAILYTARLYTSSPQLVENEVLLDCIGGAVIGGTSLFGGKGRVAGTLMGVLFITLVGNSLNMLGLRYWHVITIKGTVILLAALLDALRNRWLAGR